jgi:voltage-gated potassium channel
MRRRLLTIAALPPTLVAIGTGGYHVIEGWSLFDSLYMAVITLTTIGFAEVHPLGSAGRLFTMALSLTGIFAMFFASTELLRTWASGELRVLFGRQRMEKAMGTLNDHIIVCGYGRMGRLVCQEFSESGVAFVIIDNEETALADFSLPQGVALRGDATSDDCLKRAGIDRARALVTVVPEDADNLFIAMSARLLNDSVPIIARAEEEATASKLLRAGATRVISPYLIGGSRVAQAILRPAVLDFIEVATRSEHLELQLEEVGVTTESALAGVTIAASCLRANLNVIIVAIKRAGNATMTFNPPEDARLEAGDTLVMLGAREQLLRVEKMARASFRDGI